MRKDGEMLSYLRLIIQKACKINKTAICVFDIYVSNSIFFLYYYCALYIILLIHKKERAAEHMYKMALW